ncbi:Aste57867_12962 [Aphanomyces stellatus]|uniref:Aste57867_12962 protein n=1 Tax=Aphanomyces stellatus TaxID=120398 RepID=A0A485KXA6_9STRA|nr:hypothetical protein As57867_012914 [Aphanomyces stellatus]VFT89808.1 Aste57867_12962 [Aphanomyces stellatus]
MREVVETDGAAPLPAAIDVFQEGDLVWAKMQGFPSWPALLFYSAKTLFEHNLPIPPDITPTLSTPLVCFLDSLMYSVVPLASIRPYLFYDSKTAIQGIKKKSLKKQLEDAVSRADDILLKCDAYGWTVKDYIAIHRGVALAGSDVGESEPETDDDESDDVVEEDFKPQAKPSRTSSRQEARRSKPTTVVIEDDTPPPTKRPRRTPEKVKHELVSPTRSSRRGRFESPKVEHPERVSSRVSALRAAKDATPTKKKVVDDALPKVEPVTETRKTKDAIVPKAEDDDDDEAPTSRKSASKRKKSSHAPSVADASPSLEVLSDEQIAYLQQKLVEEQAKRAAERGEDTKPERLERRDSKKAMEPSRVKAEAKRSDETSADQHDRQLARRRELHRVRKEEEARAARLKEEARVAKAEREAALRRKEIEASLRQKNIALDGSLRRKDIDFDTWNSMTDAEKEWVREKEIAAKQAKMAKQRPSHEDVTKPKPSKTKMSYDEWQNHRPSMVEKTKPLKREPSRENVVKSVKREASKREDVLDAEYAIPKAKKVHRKVKDSDDDDDDDDDYHYAPVRKPRQQKLPSSREDKKAHEDEKAPRVAKQPAAKDGGQSTTAPVVVPEVLDLSTESTNVVAIAPSSKRGRPRINYSDDDEIEMWKPAPAAPNAAREVKPKATASLGEGRGPVLPSPLSLIWENAAEGAAPRRCLTDFVWDNAVFKDPDSYAAALAVVDAAEGDAPVRGKRQVRSVQHTQMLNKLSSGIVLDPHTMVECAQYAKEGLENAKSPAQPFNVRVHPDAVFVCDLHAHLAISEIIGFLGGRYDEPSNTIFIHAAFPCRSVKVDGDDGSTDVEMDTESELEMRELIRKSNMEAVGWYHSHPSFAPDPSIRDIENQTQYQQLFARASDKKEPFLGLIVGTYDPKRTIPMGLFRFFHVHGEKSGTGSTGPVAYLPYELKVETREYIAKSTVLPPNMPAVPPPSTAVESVVEALLHSMVDSLAAEVATEALDEWTPAEVSQFRAAFVRQETPDQMVIPTKSRDAIARYYEAFRNGPTRASGPQVGHVLSFEPLIISLQFKKQEQVSAPCLRRLRTKYGPGAMDCVEQVVRLVDYYRTYDRRINLTDLWYKKMTKLDKIRASLREYVKLLDVPTTLHDAFVEDIVQYLDLSWS